MKLLNNIIINWLSSSVLVSKNIRYLLLKLCGYKIQTRHIMEKCFFSSNNVKIGKHVFINRGCFFDVSSLIEIEDDCTIAMNCNFVTSTHSIDNEDHRAGIQINKSIKIEKGTWIGANTTILPGVCIGRGCVIAAGAVVTKNCDDNGLYAGVPAKRIRDLP